MKTWIVALALLTGCADKDEDDTSSAEACEDVAPESCDDTDGCTSLGARPTVETETGWCVDYTADKVLLGCMSADYGCGAAETPATTADAPDSCLWVFPSTCLPEGYIACPKSSLPECAG